MTNFVTFEESRHGLVRGGCIDPSGPRGFQPDGILFGSPPQGSERDLTPP